MGNKIFTVDKFFGLNESDIGQTELKMGEAPVCENFIVTDGFNLRSRPGIRRWINPQVRSVYNLYQFFWNGYIGDTECLVAFGVKPAQAYISVYSKYGSFTKDINRNVIHVVQHGKKLCAICRDMDDPTIVWPVFLDYKENSEGEWELVLTDAHPYIPMTITAAEPEGGGTNLENLNILTDNFRVSYMGKENVKEYHLPEYAKDVLSVTVSGVKMAVASAGSFNKENAVFTFNTAPEDQADVVFICKSNNPDLKAAREKFLNMTQSTYYGTTESRIFFYGDGTNVCYYTSAPALAYSDGYGVQADGVDDGTHYEVGLYVPAANEIAVDFSDSPITAMVQDYTRLMVFKPDGVEAITYDSMTLADGKVIAGFFRHTVSAEFGNDALGQVVLVNNYPRSFTQKSLYEWRVSSAYRDERFAKCVSQKITRTLAKSDPSKVIVCDDEKTKTYYAFLNDEDGTVIVNRYELDAWSVYKSELTKNVTHAFTAFDKVMFSKGGEIFCFDESYTQDENIEAGEPLVPYESKYESGYMDFGSDYLRKYSSMIWVSVKPEALSQMDITVKTDQKSEYITKTVGTNLFDFSNIDFSNFSFLTNNAPKMQRVKLKVKKFVYYKMIFNVKKPGARATVLGYDQQVRYSSQVK